MSRIGTVYGQALYDLARSEQQSEEIFHQMQVLNQSFAKEPDFLRLLSTPNLPKEERCHILDDSFRGKVHPYLLNFMKILTEKGYMRHFSECVESYREQYHLDNGILPVQAVTAVALTPEQSEKLSGKLKAITGKTIELTNRVDPTCMGGVRLDYDGKRVEDTIAHRLDTIRGLLQNTVL